MKPKRIPQNKTGKIGVRVEPEIFKQLERIAEKECRSMAQIGYIAVTEYLRRKQSEQAA
jgi:predicted transcriptional regulator